MTSSEVQKNVDDLVLLHDITEEAICECLKIRHQNDVIYTLIGEVLVSVNPFHEMKIYEEDTINRYQGHAIYELEPHIYGLAEDVFRALKMTHFNQCLIISGESGAGKTEAAKLVMRYIAAVCGSSGEIQRVKDQLLQSNPVLEAFGNAQTLRNDNSSRFGKYLEMAFDFAGQPVGGVIRNFLLEKTRVVNPGKGERCFHIFYQLGAGLTPAEKARYHFSRCEDYNYLSKSGQYSVRTINDKRWYTDTINGMKICGIEPRMIDQVKAALVAILWLGQIEFLKDGQDNSKIKDLHPVRTAAELIGVSAETLEQAMISRQFIVGAQRTKTFLNVDQAEYTRDSLAKNLYGRIFDWLIERINIAIDPNQSEKYDPNYRMTIGVLDIYGFEIFDHNSFEQFCINYANEKLQQIFIENVLRAEQQEYADEGIEWIHIEYFNNKIVCDLIEAKPIGIFCFLDEECTVPRGTDEGFLRKINESFADHPQFAKPKDYKIKQDRQTYIVKHYAGEVTYEVEGFLEKNKDLVWVDLVQLGESSNLELFDELYLKGESNHMTKKRALTQGFQFKTQVHALMDALIQCVPHYIRCIKSNDQKAAGVFDESRVLHQIQYLGLMENVRVRRAGYASRMTYRRFLRTYKMICQTTWPHWNGSDQDGTLEIANSFEWEEGKDYELGKTKIFIAEATAVFQLEFQRSHWVNILVIKIQAVYRGHFVRKRIKDTAAATVIQSCYRGHMARIIYNEVKSAMRIQRTFRRYRFNKEYIAIRKRIIAMFESSKQRRRDTLIRPFSGDYIAASQTPALLSNMSLFHKSKRDQRILFADGVFKVSPGSGKKVDLIPSICVITKIAIFIWTKGHDKPSKKVHQGDTYMLRRCIYLRNLTALTLSTLADNYVVISAKEVPLERATPWMGNSGGNCCTICQKTFTFMFRKHHCRACGRLVCAECTTRSQVLAEYDFPKAVRVCDDCYGKNACEYAGDYAFRASKKTEIVALLLDAYKALQGSDVPLRFLDKTSFQLRKTAKKAIPVNLEFSERKVNFGGVEDPLPEQPSKNVILIPVNPGLAPDFVQKQQEKSMERRAAAEERRQKMQEQIRRKAELEKEERTRRKERILEDSRRRKDAIRLAKEQAKEREAAEQRARFEAIRRRRMAQLVDSKMACKVCGCKNFTSHEIRHHKCGNCFHQH